MDDVRQLNLLDRLDRLPMTRFHKRLFAVLALSQFFFGYLLSSGASLVTSAYHSLNFGISLVAIILSATGIGVLIGSILWSFLSDAIGRRAVFQLDMAIYAVGSLIVVFSVNWEMLFIGQAIAAGGIGGLGGLDYGYMIEFFPVKSRGRWLILSHCGITLGSGLAVAMFAILPLLQVPSDWAWRVIPMIGCVGGVVVWFARRSLPESVRFLVVKERFNEAAGVVADIERSAGPRFAYVGPDLPPPVPATRSMNPLILISRRYVLYTVTLFAGFFVLDLSGAFNSYIPVVFTLGLGGGVVLGAGSAVLVAELIQVTALVLKILTASVIDRFGRKFCLCVGLGVAALALAVWAYPFTHRDTVPLAFVVIPGVFYTFTNVWLVSFNVLTPELYPTAARIQAVGYGSAAGRVGLTVGPYIFAFFLATNLTPLFYIYAGCMATILLMTLAFIPETAGRRLQVTAQDTVEEGAPTVTLEAPVAERRMLE